MNFSPSFVQKMSNFSSFEQLSLKVFFRISILNPKLEADFQLLNLLFKIILCHIIKELQFVIGHYMLACTHI